MSHPEKIPSSKVSDFTFSFNSLYSAKDEIQSQYDALEQRIYSIVDSEKFYINNVPVLQHILVLSPKKKDLKLLAKAIGRLADLVEVHSSLQSKLSVIEAVQKDPNWFAWTFADHDVDIEKEFTSLFNDTDN
jgi:hypothetical protein